MVELHSVNWLIDRYKWVLIFQLASRLLWFHIHLTGAKPWQRRDSFKKYEKLTHGEGKKDWSLFVMYAYQKVTNIKIM